MNETIRKEQINWLSQSLKSGATFNAILNRNSLKGTAMSLIATHGQWYMTQEDLNAVLSTCNRGVKGKIDGEYMYLWRPDIKKEKQRSLLRRLYEILFNINLPYNYKLPMSMRLRVAWLTCKLSK